MEPGATAPDTGGAERAAETTTSTLPIRPQGKWATPDDWTAAKSTIKHLYMEENLPLKEVMAIMEEKHNFRGTVKMYKSKLNEWGLFKTFKPREVLAALRVLEARQAAGVVDPIITMRGTEVDLDWVRSYIKRNRKKINKLTRLDPTLLASNTQHSNRNSDNMAVACRTPSPRPPLPPSQGLVLAEELLRAVTLYVDTAFTGGLWYIDDHGLCRSRKDGSSSGASVSGSSNFFLLDVWDRLDRASQAMKRAEKVNLVDILNPAFAHLNVIIREEDPRSFPFLLGCLETLRLRGRMDLMTTFLKYAWQLSATLLGANYPHARIWRQTYMMICCYADATGPQKNEYMSAWEEIYILLLDRYHTEARKDQKVAAALRARHKKILNSPDSTTVTSSDQAIGHGLVSVTNCAGVEEHDDQRLLYTFNEEARKPGFNPQEIYWREQYPCSLMRHLRPMPISSEMQIPEGEKSNGNRVVFSESAWNY
ncbi:Clr5 domain-containing protein [Apodospora peruviana]|uniref:Clr5 domain-containing protein n=1 Tax=Apodospora peruviana TaxID=516989 RepID=A0AAE0IBG5_9PEZI|nr:Clr5 domain-containing protein [Apodospora peruviana]